jgi:hypothetical protein
MASACWFELKEWQVRQGMCGFLLAEELQRRRRRFKLNAARAREEGISKASA